MKKILLGLGAFMLATSSSMFAAEGALDYETNAPTLYGYLLYDAETFTSSNTPYGIYSMDVTPEVKIDAVNLSVRSNGGGCYHNGKYYAIEYTSKYGSINSCKLKVYNTLTWEAESTIDASEKAISTTMTYNPVDNQIYGCFFDNESDVFVFGTLDLETGTPQPIKVMDFALRALAANADGTLYGISEVGDFYRYDANTTDFVKIGATGFEPKNLQDATFDYGTKQLYWAAANDTESGIYTVDIATGVATKVSSYATGYKEFYALYSTNPVYDALVPGMVDNVQFVFATTAVEGIIKFVMPTVNYGGASLSGSLKYEISVDGTNVVEGTSEAGASVDVPLTLQRGDHRIAIFVSNDMGSGPSFNIHRFIGEDVPSAVTGFKAVRINNQVYLSWNAVMTGANNGPFDPEKIRYDIIRQPDGVKVATNIEGTTFVDTPDITELGNYYYEITATDGEMSSVPVKSSDVIIGNAIVPPYSYDFRNRAGFGFFTVVDANNDGSSWMTRDNYGVIYFYSSVNDADDWLISPPLKLNKGVRYEVSAEMGSAMFPERVEIKYGTSTDPADLNKVIVEPMLIEDGTYNWPETCAGYLTPEEDGEYYVGIHCISDADLLFCYCAEFNIVPDSSSNVSDAISSNSIVSSQNGAIVIIGAEGENVTIYSVTGVCVANQAAQSVTTIPVAPGLYVVKVGAKAVKVRVK